MVAVARHESYSRAAATLHLSQSALSRSIQAIEADLGVTLFERSPSGVRTTPSGALFVRQATALIAATEDLEGTMRRLQRIQGEQVNFGLGPMPASLILPCLFAERARAAAGGRLRAHVLTGMTLRGMLEDGTIEFIVCAEGALTPRLNLVQQMIGSVPIAVRVRVGHPLLSLDSLSVENLSRYPMIGGGLASSLSDEIVPGSILYDPVLACDNYEILAQAVAQSDAYCFFPCAMKTPGLEDLEVSTELVPSTLEMVLVENSARPLSNAAMVAVARIRELLGEHA